MDSEEYTKNKIINWLIILGAMVLSAISWFLDLSSLIPGSDWRLFAIIFTIIFIFSSIYRITRLESILSSRIPNIVIRKLFTTRISLGNSLTWQVSTGYSEDYNSSGIHRIARMSLANEPKHSTEFNHAKRVAVELTYKAGNGKILLGPIYGRWSNTDRPSSQSEYKEDKYIFQNLDSSGLSKSIDLAYKMDSSNRCYAFSNVNYIECINYYPFWLKEEKIIIEILLIGERVKKKFKCALYNDGEGNPIRVEMYFSWLEKFWKKLK